MKTFYPHLVDASCGMHVHMSFKTAFTYQRTMVPTFPATIVASVKSWATAEGLPKDHPLWPRLEGKSRYCQHTFDADNQVLNTTKDFVQDRKGHRYTVINYNYGRTNTIECRLLPMMQTVEQALRAVQTILDTTNNFLVATAEREKKVVSEVVVDSGTGIRISKSKGGQLIVDDNGERVQEVRRVIV